MAEARIVFIYRQHFKDGQEPFTKDCCDAQVLGLAKEAFHECGGRKIVDVQISIYETWRVSYWYRTDGYASWLANKKAQEYLSQRDIYNQKNNILTDLWGPFSANEIFVEKT